MSLTCPSKCRTCELSSSSFRGACWMVRMICFIWRSRLSLFIVLQPAFALATPKSKSSALMRPRHCKSSSWKTMPASSGRAPNSLHSPGYVLNAPANCFSVMSPLSVSSTSLKSAFKESKCAAASNLDFRASLSCSVAQLKSGSTKVATRRLARPRCMNTRIPTQSRPTHKPRGPLYKSGIEMSSVQFSPFKNTSRRVSMDLKTLAKYLSTTRPSSLSSGTSDKSVRITSAKQ
mmetsp:Transcript_82410/g.229605  ORF Transcript_82410/g.229605 Transcript_82410/m.229605 type:complete len:233 (+) Transcript_82410:818-1516(+)